MAGIYSAEIQPFDLTRITELVEKTNFDAAVKSKFLSQVKERLFHSHKTFLANPLLCTMMILTFTEFEEIPSKMHIFYARAFDVLFTRHDKTKTFFNRKSYTTLAEDDFKRLFSTFCLFSYLEGAYSFDRASALKFLKWAFEFEGVIVEAGDFLSDMHESISILVKDGDTYSFLHRSFQEYFSAVFLAERQLPEMDELFERILENSSGESVLTLLFEMNRDALESKFLIRKVHLLREELERLDPEHQLPEILHMFLDSFKSEGRGSLLWSSGLHGQLLNLLHTCYGSKYAGGKAGGPIVALSDVHHWLHMVGTEASPEFVDVLSIPNSRLAASPVAKRITGIRSEILKLDESLLKKDKGRGSFLRNLLKKS